MKMISKTRGWAYLCTFAILLVLVLYTAFEGWGYDYAGSMNDIKLGLDLRGGVSITYQAVGDETPSDQDMADTVYKMEQRVASYSTEAEVSREGTNRVTINIPGETDANAVLEELGQPGTLVFCTDTSDVEGTTRLDGNDITTAAAGYNGENQIIVSVTFNEEGQRKFAEVTGELAGTGDPLYIIYDGEVISAPTCEQQITSATCEISGMSSLEEAESLASYIRVGALPIQLEEIRSQVVGARLGTDAIDTSLLAAGIGLAIIFLFMIIMYRIPGLAASLALLAYTGLIIVLLAAFNQEITLTLPGIAGIVLGIGMAVDANVIIFSRIREEIGLGRAVDVAIKEGFAKALSAIVDGNVTTLIAAVVLFMFGSGVVQGFAVTLALGIVLSMFTSLVVTRFVLKAFYAIGFQDKKFYGETAKVKVRNFLGRKNICFILSGVIIIVGIVAFVGNSIAGDALNYSLEFKGGTSTSVIFNENRTVEQLESEVKPEVEAAIGSTDVVMTPVVGSNEVIIRTQELSLDQRDALYQVLEEKFSVNTADITNENISGTVSDDMKRSAVISVILATIAMLIYIWFRFRDVRFASSAVVALLHDVLVVLTCYAIFRWSVGNTFIACMLTLVGYSVNATIVIFDRIRENQKVMGSRADLKDVVNTSISQTLGRSINTSLTTFVMVAMLYILGVTSIREFALPLMVGVVVGAYSSVCITGALWYVMKTKFGKKQPAIGETKKK